jgi:hypothetical protein
MKVILWILGIVVVLIAGAAVFFLFNASGLIKTAIENLGSEALQTEVSVNELEFSASEASADVRGLSVANPQGYSAGDAFAIDQFKVAVSTEQPGGGVVVLDKVIIDGARVLLEFKGLDVRKDSNLQKLLDNLDETAGTSSEPPSESVSTSDEVKVIINQLDFTNAQASVISDVLGNIDVDVPNILLRDIGRRENGVVAAEAIRQLLDPLIKILAGEVAKKSTGIDVDNLADEAEKELKDRLTESLRSRTN